jgi:hypothetical protein
MSEKGRIETPDTGESGETYDQEIEADHVLSSLPFSFSARHFVER